jgi:hypothetical protein
LHALPADGDDLGDAGDREQPLADDPVGQRAQLHRWRRAVLAVHADEHDLAHDGRDWGELRTDAARQTVRGECDFLGDDLPVDVDIGAPFEFNVNDRQADCGRAAHGLDAGRAVDSRLEREGDQSFDFLGGHAGGFGHDGHPWAIQVGKYVDGQMPKNVAAVDERHDSECYDDESVAKRQTDNGVKHQSSPPT